MKNTAKAFGLMILGLIMFTSCDNQKSIQEYYVEKQESNDFIAIDLPASIVDVGENASEETRATLKTIKKLNVLAFQLDDSNKAEYEKEQQEIKSILKNDRYNELMRMRHEGMNIVINYQGSDDAVDEFILFASDETKGFALARVLGDKMEPAKIMKMAEDMKNLDADGAALAELGEIFSDIGVD
jgi:ERCC4-related helicase